VVRNSLKFYIWLQISGNRYAEEYPVVELRTFRWVVVAVAVYALLGFIVLPMLARYFIEDYFSRTYGRQVGIESISINPFFFSFGLSEVDIPADDGGSLLFVDEVYVDVDLFFPIFRQTIDLDEVKLHNPRLIIAVDSAGHFNFASYLGSDSSAAEPEVADENSDLGMQLRLGSLAVENMSIAGYHGEPTENFELYIDSISFQLQDLYFPGEDTAAVALAMQFRHGGKATLSGHLQPQLPALALQWQIDSLALQPFQAYVSEFSELRIDKGALFFGGEAIIAPDTTAAMQVSYGADFRVADLRIYDRLKQEPFLAWHDFRADGITGKLQPLQLRLQEISIDSLFTRVAIAADQSLNISDALRLSNTDTSAAAAVSDQAAGDTLSSPDIIIGRLNLRNSSAYFSDMSLPFPFAARIHSLNGQLLDIFPNNPGGSKLDLEGTVNTFGYAGIKGHVDVFSPIDYLDIQLLFKNIDLVSLTPYSAKFAGYKIESGKMSLDLNYLLRQGQLIGQNELSLNRFNLGAEVDSPDAPSLPIKLAIALLKDGNGDIDLDLEVKGDLADPEVGIWSLVGQALLRVVTTLVTAPFTFLGELIGISGAELEYIDFPVGQADLPPHQREKLNDLLLALAQRPSLRLRVHGAFDSQTDKRALQTIAFEKLFNDQLDKADSIAIDNRGMAVMTALYRQNFSAGVVDSLRGQLRIEQVPEAEYERELYRRMRGRLIASQQLDSNRLPLLARDRAQTIRRYFLRQGELDSTRIHTGEIEEHDGADEEWVASRLEVETVE
jgi:flagellar motor protein MotB